MLFLRFPSRAPGYDTYRGIIAYIKSTPRSKVTLSIYSMYMEDGYYITVLLVFHEKHRPFTDPNLKLIIIMEFEGTSRA